MPSKSMWVFDWLYGKAMPALLGSTYLKETKLSLTDGDRNEYQPLENQIVTGTFTLSQHGLCGFHLVDQSIVSNPFGKPGAKKEMAFQAIKRHMKRWIYSWMRTVESKKEYETSRRLLIEWLQSDAVAQATTPYIAKNMKDWLVAKIFPFVDYLRTYGEYSNSVAEVEVNTLKEGNSVMQNMAIGTSGRATLHKSRYLIHI